MMHCSIEQWHTDVVPLREQWHADTIAIALLNRAVATRLFAREFVFAAGQRFLRQPGNIQPSGDALGEPDS